MKLDHRSILQSSLYKALLAAGPPLLVYIWTASGYAYWLDSGEFVATATDFGISHPPGHPLTAIALSAANVLPIGPLAFRVALVCALLAAVALVALFFACETTLRTGDAVSPRLCTPLSLAATWWVAGTPSWWLQSVRPEVYALQAALLCIAFERLLKAAATGPNLDVRPLFHAALALGLGLANHHYLTLLAYVPSVWLLGGLWRAAGWRPFAWSAVFTGAGLLTYVLLPLRAFSEPYLNLGEPTSVSRLFWVVSAQAFQKSLTPTQSRAFGERLGDVLATVGQDLHVVVLTIGALGVYFMLRIPACRRYGLFWLTAALCYAMGRGALGFVRGNPDAAGYLMMVHAAGAVCAAFAIGVLLSALAESLARGTRLAAGVAIAIAAATLFQFPRSSDRASLSSFVDTDVFDDWLRRALPPRSVVLVHNPDTIFRYWGGEAEEQIRPDVTMVPLPLITYPKLASRYVERHPELKGLLRDYMLDGRINPTELQSLAALRPVFVELDVRVPQTLYESMSPEHLFHRVATPGAELPNETEAARAHELVWSEVYEGISRPIDPQTSAQLLWRHYLDALYFAAVGDTRSALRASTAGLEINPRAEELVRLNEVLKSAPSDERIDVGPFLVPVTGP